MTVFTIPQSITMTEDLGLQKDTKQQKRLSFVTRRSQAALNNELQQLDRERYSTINELDRVKKLFLVR